MPLAMFAIFLLTACGPEFPRTGEVQVITPHLSGILKWKTEKDFSGEPRCYVTVVPNSTNYAVESGYCTKKLVLRALQKNQESLLGADPDEWGDYLKWLEEAIRTVGSLEGEELVRSGMPTSTPAAARLEVAVILDANTDEEDLILEALSIYGPLMDQWRDRKQEICNIPFRTPIPEELANKYPESVLVVDNPEPYEIPAAIPLKIVATDSLGQTEFPVKISVRVNILRVEGPEYWITGQGYILYRAFGYRTSGFVELSVPASGLEPVRFTGETEPVFPSAAECQVHPIGCQEALSGSGGGADFIGQLLEKGLDLELQKAVESTVDCQ